LLSFLHSHETDDIIKCLNNSWYFEYALFVNSGMYFDYNKKSFIRHHKELSLVNHFKGQHPYYI